MKKVNLLKKSGVVGIIVLFICASFASSIGGYSEETNQIDTDVADVYDSQENVLVTCSTFGFPGEPSQETSMSQSDAEFLYDKIKELQIEIARDPLSDKTQQLQHEIIILADEHDLLPAGLSVETLKSRLTPSLSPQHPQRTSLPRLQNRASELFCNYVSTGSGTSFPIIVLPRLIPILLTPIPRLFVRWSTLEGITSCGGLRSGTGFIATGAQNGIALGFWGIGFSIFLPPVMAYGLFGYALYASVNAENIELWPPNYAPEISAVSPLDGANNVPVSTSELGFQINDDNGDLMSYSVTTTPDIGSGSGNNKPDGAYTVPISGLEGSEEYTWHIQVTDGEDVTDASFTFTTEPVAPIVSDPNPDDDARYVPLDLSQLSFHLSDPQGDLMDYTVETSPDIGSGSGSGVGDGTYSVDVSDLDHSKEYSWYVNVTDGINWKHKVFTFQAEHQMVFDPFDEGWQYRKNITIDHTKVAGDLTNFPVLVSTIDTDLRDKAQDDGDDILFMDGNGVATRLYHEIARYDGSIGELISWVNVTSVASNENTMFYLYYGNSSSNSQQSPEKVWDSSYCGVWHLDDFYDSTYNNNDGTIHGATWTTGISGYCLKFDGENDYMDITDSSDFEFTNQNLTYSAWVQIYDNANHYRIFIALGDANQQYGYPKIVMGKFRSGSHDGRIYMEVVVSGTQCSMPLSNDDGDTLPKYEWIYLTGVVDYPDSLKLYVNAEFQGSDSLLDFDMSEAESLKLNIGSLPYPGWNGEHGRHKGLIDEVRILKKSRSQQWISTEYNNQNDPSGFLIVGPEEICP